MPEQTAGGTWLEEETARRYQQFSEKTTMYQDLSRRMIEIADVRPGMRVLDLGCGTGITTQAVLERLGTEGHIYALDISAPMIAVARRQISSSQVTFLEADAANFADRLEEAVDRVVCNSVFWQFRRKPEVMAQIGRVLRPDGRFVFNVPERYLIFKSVPRSKHVAVLFKQLASERYGVGVQDLRSIERFLNNQGFEVLGREELERSHSAEESYLFMQIPVATAWMDPPLSYDTRLEMLEEAWQQADQVNQSSNRRWMYFVTCPKP
jgi:ubiquinone/menaquinone biosynthesis C-methylase UbiE